MNVKSSRSYVDILHSKGAPVGGIGTGYFVYGKYGFTNVNFNGFPEQKQTADYPHTNLWDYTVNNSDDVQFALFVTVNGKKYYLQEQVPYFADGYVSKCIESKAFMPFVINTFETKENVTVRMLMYSSVKPHSLKNTSIPASAIRFEIKNGSQDKVKATFGFDYDKNVFSVAVTDNSVTAADKDGNISFICENSNFELKAGETAESAAAIGWYYKVFVSQGLARDDIILRHNSISNYVPEENRNGYDRYYALNYKDSYSVAYEAINNYKSWQETIENWHNSYDIPDYVKRVLFGSFASVVTSSLLTYNGYFFEIEQPHGCLNTMDVSVYSTWLYMINWPEIEEKDLYQYIRCIPMTGENKGKVWHSLWQDGAHYVEEAIYAVRIWRFALWSGDKDFLKDAYPTVKAALEFMYSTDGYGSLINNPSGNQSYDAWKMPGIDAYVNTQWIYALFSFVSICKTLNIEPLILEKDAKKLLDNAIREYKEILWDEKEGYFKAYLPNEKSNFLPFGDAVFADQLFGFWAVCIDKNAKNVIEESFNKRALQKIYRHNRITDESKGLSCWLNGVMPDKEETYKIHKVDGEYEECGYHALCCWVSTEMELASLCYRVGLDETGEDIFKNVSEYMGNNVLAVGEYNRALGKNFKPDILEFEPGKDTPRFPPYPRYKSSWEHIISLLKMEMDFEFFYFNPTKNADITLNGVTFGTEVFNIKVSKNWNKCLVDGKESVPKLKRDKKIHNIEFICQA